MNTRRQCPMFESLEARSLLSTFIVDTALDESDGDFGAGDFSLREAVEEANAQPGADSITFAPALAGSTITLGGTELKITDGLSISGLGTGQLTVSGNSASRIFDVDDDVPGASIAVSISGMTLSRGAGAGGGAVINNETLTLTGVRITGSTSALDGAGLLNLASVIVNACTFDHNSSVGDGGALNNEVNATLNVVNSTFNDNSSVGDGGAIWSSGTAAIADSTFTKNAANSSGGGGGSIFTAAGSTLVMHGGTVSQSSAFKGGGVGTTGTISLFDVWVTGNSSTAGGGGIASYSGASVTLEGTTLSGNITGEGGGGIAARGPLSIRNSTISGNAAADSGGGVLLVDASATISNSTIVFNGGAGGNGGGVFVQNGTLTLNSTIVAFNAIGQPPVFNEFSLSTAGLLSAASANNLVGDAATAGGLVNGANGNIVGADPRLGPLVKQGGSAPTHTLMAGSPAIDKGANPLGLTADQRGYARIGGTAIDIGAYETRVYPTTAGPSRLVYGAADNTNTHRTVTINQDSAVIVFEQGWTVANLQELTGAPAATSDAVIWVDPKDGLTYVAAPSAAGFILFTRAANGSWSFRNLTTELTAPESITGNLTQFTSTGGIVVVAGTTGTGKLAAFQQTLATATGGGPAFKFVDVSAQIIANGAASTPALTGLISYVTTWDAWTIAGIDSAGDIQAVWLHIPGGTVTTWRLDNLSIIHSAPPIIGQLAVTLTPWGGINLTGLDSADHLITTWWVIGGEWQTNDLTFQTSGTTLVSGQVTGYSTPWGGLNYAGLDTNGTVTVYWWAPGMQTWNVVPLLPSSVPASQRPVGALTSYYSAAGTLNVFGTSGTSDVIRLSWRPNDQVWTAEDLTTLAVKM